jgi:hypothetical protein
MRSSTFVWLTCALSASHACSDNTSLGNDRSAQQDMTGDAALSLPSNLAVNPTATSDDGPSVAPIDDGLSASEAGVNTLPLPQTDAVDDVPEDTDTAQTPAEDTVDSSAENTADESALPPATDDTAPLLDASAPPPGAADAAAFDPISLPSDASLPESDPEVTLVSEDFMANFYNPELQCFELVRTYAGSTLYDPDNPFACGAAFTLGVSPEGECWSFSSTCQPDGFVAVMANATPGDPHECVGASSCELDWECSPGEVPVELNRSCTTDEDCFARLFTGPCGCSVDVIGFNRNDSSALSAYVDTCVDPNMCECPVPSPMTDSDEIVPNLGPVVVECIEQQCVTRRDPEFCSSGSECVSQSGECVATAPDELLNAAGCRDAAGHCELCP